ncbi:MAG: class I SAM-dependent methyltransferase [Candidatus Rariloculaceae bacterium]
MRTIKIAFLSIVFSIFNTSLAQTNISAILADPTRPVVDRERDASRKPDQVLAFFDIGPGDKVADLLCGGGYYTRILTPLVGTSGEVYAGNNPFFQRFGEETLTALLGEPGFERVHRIDGPVDELALPTNASMDAVIIALAYHDLWLTDENRDELNRRVFDALKSGGVYGIIDHSAAAGSGTDVIDSLHRIEENVIIDEISTAGFSLAARGDFLRNSEDDRSLRIFDPSVRGNTDRFVLRFEKP